MATTKHLRSGTLDKRPTTAIAEGQLALNTNAASPGLYFKDSAGTGIIKVGPCHVGNTAPNAVPPSGGSSGNSVGEQWLDTSGANPVLKVWDGSVWQSQSGEYVNANGDTMSGALVMDNQQQVRFRETTANGTNYIAIQAPASVSSDKTLTLPDATGTLVSTGDTGSVTNTMLAGSIANNKLSNSTITVNSSSTALGGSVTLYAGTTTLQTSSANQGLTGISSIALPGATSGTITVTPAATAGTTAITVPATSGTLVTTGDSGTVTSTMLANGTIVNEDINASAAIAGTKIAPDFGAQNVTTTGTSTAASYNPTSATVPANGVFLPAANSIGLATNSVERFRIDSAGQIEAAGLGSAAAPTYSWISDPNTGIYSPGADQVAISTNGVGRVFVSSSGDVTIGHTSSGYSGTGRGIIGVNGSSSSLIDLQTGAASRFRIFCNGTNTELVNTEAAGNVVFGTNSLERLRITDAGLVGIGSSAPQGRFESAAGDSTAYAIVANNNYSTGDQNYISLTASTTQIGSINRVTNDIAIKANYAGVSFWTGTGGTATQKAVIDSSGRLGIGNTTPGNFNSVANQVVVGSGSGDAGITLSTGTSSSGYLAFCDTGNTVNQGWYGYSHTDNALLLGANGSERARIDSSGRLLVGTSSARSVGGITGKVQIEGTQYPSSTLSIVSTVDFPLIEMGKSGPTVTAVKANDGLGAIVFNGYDGSTFDSNAAIISAYVDGTPGANDMPGRLVFSTTADGASSPTERLRITSTGQVRLAGAGITFNGDTATANELDDYEEGTWTATVTGSSTAGTVTYEARVTSYTKIGRLVTIFYYIYVSNFTGTGNIVIGGLPFTVSAQQSAGACMAENLTLPANTKGVVLYPAVGTASASIYAYFDNAAWAPVACDASFSIIGSATYQV